jgi:hypothetical protein
MDVPLFRIVAAFVDEFTRSVAIEFTYEIIESLARAF